MLAMSFTVANKFAGLFVMYNAVMASLGVLEVAGEEGENFRLCYNNCYEECIIHSRGNTFCETKCDEVCSVEETTETILDKPYIHMSS